MTRLANAGLNDHLEQQVDLVQTARRIAGGAGSALEDREFARLLDLLTPRIRHMIHVYRLTDMREDAEQACAIAVLRAVETYDPSQARFTTHVTWQLRGELQSLRHRVRLDQRRSARSAGIRTVQLGIHAGGDMGDLQIADDHAIQRTEEGASLAMALEMLEVLLDELKAPEHERQIVVDQLLDIEPRAAALDYSAEQRRQITRRTYRNCAKVVLASRNSSV